MEDLAVVTLGCLFHDLGKIVQRANPNPMAKSHPIYGADFLNSLGLCEIYQDWTNVVDCVKFHHWKQIKTGDFDSRLAWFAYEADNLASAHDRKSAPELFDAEGNRIDECEMQDKNRWNSKVRLNSVFSSFEGARKGNREKYRVSKFGFVGLKMVSICANNIHSRSSRTAEGGYNRKLSGT